MDAPTLTPDEARELAGLRARAYGPGADISADAAAQRRLAELEAQRRPEIVVEHAPVVPAWRREGSAPVPAHERPSVDVILVPDEQDEDAATALAETAALEPEVRQSLAERYPWLARVPVWAWVVAASAVVVALAIVWGVTQFVAPRSDVSLAAVSTDAQPPEQFVEQGFYDFYDLSPESLQQFESYRGLTIWSASNARGDACLIVVTEQFQYGASAGCTPRGLDPIVDFTFWPGLPPEVMGDYPQGTVARFQLTDGRVHVWQRSPESPS